MGCNDGRRGVCVFGSMLALASVATAGISDVVFDVMASNDLGKAHYQVTFSQGSFNPTTGIFTWSSGAPVSMVDTSTGNLIATLLSGSTLVREQFVGSFGYYIEYGFSAETPKSQLPTTFTVTSAQLSYPTVPDAAGRATATLTAEDLASDGAALIGLYDPPAASIFQYNGLAPGGGKTFSSLVADVIAGPGGKADGSQTFPAVGFTTPVGEPVANHSIQMSFTLTPGDRGGGSGTFRILPEPGVITMLAAAMGVLALRRR
jgi:hypothetical protein